MSQATIGNLNVRMGLDTAEFSNGVRTIQGSLSNLTGALKGFATAAAATSLYNLSIDAIKAVAEIGDVAESIGVTAEQLQVFQKMAIASGTSTDVLTRGLQSIAEQSVDTGSKLAQLFEANGLTVKGKETNEIIREFMDLVKNAKTPAEQLAIITGVLGDKVGRGLVEAFRAGADGADTQYARMKAAGEIHLNAEVARIQELETKYNQVTDRIATYWQRMIVGLVSGADTIEFKYIPGRGGGRSAVANRPPINAMPTTNSGMGAFGGPNEFASPPVPVRITVLPPPPAETEKVKQAVADAVTPPPIDTSAWDFGRQLEEQVRTPLEQYQAEIAKINDAWNAGAIGSETYSRAIKQAQDAFSEAAPEANRLNEALTQIGDTIASSLSSSLSGLMSGTMSVADAFSNMANSIINSLADIAASLITSGLQNALMGSVSPSQGTGSLLGSLFKRASGGAVMAGRTYMVGERGPELFTAGTSGRIVPNNRLGSGGSGVTVNVNTVNNSSANVRTQRTQNADGSISIETLIEDKILDTLGGGKAAKVMGGRFGARVLPRRM